MSAPVGSQSDGDSCAQTPASAGTSAAAAAAICGMSAEAIRDQGRHAAIARLQECESAGT